MLTEDLDQGVAPGRQSKGGWGPGMSGEDGKMLKEDQP